VTTPVAVAGAVAFVLAMAVLAGAVSFVVAVVYRWWGRVRVPEGVALLVGVTAVALVLNTQQTLMQFIDSGDGVDVWRASRTVATFAASSVVADLGRRVGDRIADGAFEDRGYMRLDRELAQVVTAGGRVVRVDLPETVEDIDGYDPVPVASTAEFAGASFVFPRRVTVGELADRIRARLQDDYGVGHVEVDVTADGEVTHLAVGAREAGLSPTLTPGTVAVAVRADPANAASAGDVVQVWGREREDTDGPGSDAAVSPTDAATADRGGESASGSDGTRRTRGDAPMRRVASAEVRATAGDVVTLAVDESDVEALADDVAYRLVTLPRDERSDREFATLLRRATETVGVVTVAADDPLTGVTVGSLAVTVAAIRDSTGAVTPTPTEDTRIESNATLFVVGRPDALRAFEGRSARSPDGELDDSSNRDESSDHDASDDTDDSGDREDSGEGTGGASRR
jgi:hypothetical protein